LVLKKTAIANYFIRCSLKVNHHTLDHDRDFTPLNTKHFLCSHNNYFGNNVDVALKQHRN